MMLSQSFDVEEMEYTLQLWEYGRFVCHDEKGPQLSVPSWVFEIKSGEDREKNLHRYIGPIDHEYAFELDAKIAAMPLDNKNVIYLYYIKAMPIRKIAKIMRRTDHTIKDLRKGAIHYLYGELAAKIT